LLVFLFFRPIVDSIDILRTFNIPFVHINTLQFIGISVPYLLLVIIFFNKANLCQHGFLNTYLVFLLSCIPSILFTNDYVFDVASILRLFTFWSIVIFTTTFVTSLEEIKQVLFVILLSSFYPLVKFSIDYFTGHIIIIGGIERNLGGYFHMSVISTLLLLFIPAYIFFLLTENRMVKKALIVISIGIIILCIYLTQYRTTLIGVAALFITFLLIQKKYISTFLVCLFFMLVIIATPDIQERFTPLWSALRSLPVLIDPNNSNLDGLLSGRFGIWRSIITSILYKAQLQNFFFGFGQLPIMGLTDTSPHSDFLGIWYQYGIISIIFFCFYLIRTFIAISKGMDNNLSKIVYSTMIALLVVSFAHVTLQDVRNLLYLGVYIALAVKHTEISIRESHVIKTNKPH